MGNKGDIFAEFISTRLIECREAQLQALLTPAHSDSKLIIHQSFIQLSTLGFSLLLALLTQLLPLGNLRPHP